MGPSAQDVFREYGHEHRVRHTHEGEEGQVDQHVPDGRKAEGVGVSLLQSVQDSLPCLFLCRTGDPHGGERPDHGHEAQRIQEKADPLARDAEQEARDGGPHKPCAVKHEGVEGDGVSEVISPVEHVPDKGLACRDVKGGDGAHGDPEQEDVPDRYVPGEGQERQNRSLYGCQRLNHDEETKAMPSVCEDPCELGKQKGGQLAGKTDQPKKKG